LKRKRKKKNGSCPRFKGVREEQDKEVFGEIQGTSGALPNKQTLVAKNVLNSIKFIDGCTSYKAESALYHEKSAAHPLAQQCHRANLLPPRPQQI